MDLELAEVSHFMQRGDNWKQWQYSSSKNMRIICQTTKWVL